MLKPSQPALFHGDKPDEIDAWLFAVDMYREAACIAGITGDASFVAFASFTLER